MSKILIICGPTASGKTGFAVACAKKLNTEIVSADSQLVYKGLDIGTAKPTEDERQGIIHHLIDVADPKQNFSVFDYAEQAIPIVEQLLNSGKTPIICGGTGFYINSILFDFAYGHTGADTSVRDKYNGLLSEKGKEYIYSLLQSVDPETAEKLHVNDTKRVVRALEIYEASGRKKSDQHDELIPKYDYLAVAINYPREELYRRIDIRVDQMFECGLVEEIKNLLASGVDENCQSMQAIGYKEVLKCLKNGDNQSTMRDTIKQNTRHYAKRQITFFKKLPNILWLEPDEATPEKIAELLNER